MSKNKTILIAEDSPTQALKLEHLLLENNYKCIMAKNGEDALRIAELKIPDMVISDVIMPKLNGYELCEKINSNNKLKHIPVILLTTLNKTENILKGLQSDADYYITKPYDEEYLLEKVDLLLKEDFNKACDNEKDLTTYIYGKPHIIKANKRQILNLLLSTHQNLVIQNQELNQTQKELKEFNESLEEKVMERTNELVKEIEDHKKTELALRKSETQSTNLIERNADPLLIVSKEKKVLFLNQEARKIFNTKLSAIENFYFEIPFSNTNTKEYILKSADNKSRTFDVRYVELEWDSEKTYLVSLRDISILKEIQSELEDAKCKAELANRQKSEFLANIAHDFRSPLNVIYGFSEVLADKEADEEDKADSIRFIRESSKNLMNLVNDLVDNAKIEAGQIDIKYRPVELTEFSEQIFSHYEKTIKNAELNFRMNIPEEKLNILMDPTRLRQILGNLIDNAVKFTDKGLVEFGYFVQSEKEILFYVKDTGRGISKIMRDDIFNRYVRDVNKGEKIKGSGLGLSIVKQLVELMGGKIWLESEENKGTTFYFTLHFEPDNEIISTEPKEIVVPDLSNKNILIVEDEEMNYYYLNSLLSKTNCKTNWAKNGLEAINFIENNNTLDLILLDLKMPVMDGYKTAEEIRKRKWNIPIIVQTAFVMDNEEEKCLQLGCNDFINKPIIAQTLYSKINMLLSKQEVI